MVVGLLMLAGGAAAGLFGSLLGLGGGILIVPLLTLGFGRSLREAVAISLVCVIATSSAAAGRYLGSRIANLRLGLVLTLFTATGALIGGVVAFLIPERLLEGLFAVLLSYVAYSMLRRPEADERVDAGIAGDTADGALGDATRGVARASAALSTPEYEVRRLVPGSLASIGAGVVSALLGIGGGAVNVPTMHLLMGVPLRAAAATSNLMIGITAVASAIIYLQRGAIDPYIAGPTVVGVFIGATVGARVSSRVDASVLRWLFVLVLAWTAFQMAQRAIAG